MRRNDGLFRSDSKTGKHFDEIVSLYNDGWSTQRIGRKFGIDPSNIYRAMKSREIKLRNYRESVQNALQKGVLVPRSGKNAARWRGGITKHSNGYILIRCPGHPRTDNRGYVPEHVLVAESQIGRALRADEVVHHINRKKDDNRPENLKVMTIHNHQHLHGKEGALKRWDKLKSGR